MTSVFRRLAKFILIALLAAAAQSHAEAPWIATWGASPAQQLRTDAEILNAHLQFDNQTLREIVHTSVGGHQLRIRLSNAFGKETLRLPSVHIAVSAGGSACVPGTDRAVTFGGRTTALIPVDASLLSDAITLDFAPASDLVVSIYLPSPTTGAGIHYSAYQTNYIGSNDQTGAETFTSTTTLSAYVFMTDIEVLAPDNSATLVAFGDSITDGALSTPSTNRRWPNVLAARLLARKDGPSIGVVNAGIGGNRLLHDPVQKVQFGVNALARFDRDVLALPSVKYVILMEGINDIGHPGTGAPLGEEVTADEIIGAYTQLIERAHQHGIKIYAATLTPFAVTTIPNYYSADKEVQRKAVNAWIRTSKAFDGVIDFEAAVRDPANPDKMLPAYDSGDHLHPGDAGYKAMGEAVDLSLFR